MDRLAKKCVIASAAMHGTLVVLLLVGPAFLSSDDKPKSNDIITFIPDQIIEGAVAGGGNPGAASRPPAPRPTPVPRREEHPAPPPPRPRQEARTKTPREAPKPPKRETKPEPESRRPKISLKEITRNTASDRAKEIAASVRARERADARARAARYTTAAAAIRSGASSSVVISSSSHGGVGGGGPSYASFEAVLRSVYFNNWHEPTDATVDDAVVKATVTIASDGAVLSARITKSSGDPAVDRSVQRLLEDVTYIAPFPKGAKEKQRTYPLSFSLKAKRGLG